MTGYDGYMIGLGLCIMVWFRSDVRYGDSIVDLEFVMVTLL